MIEIPLEKIRPNPNQPRRRFEGLEELAQSLRDEGQLTPILVRPDAVTLERTVFEVNRELEFFSEKELQMQIGHGREWWPVALLKELVDNGLDACETANVAPRIEVVVEPDSFSVRDNGPGLPAETLTRSLDYLVRVSDKNYYVSPTRGQMGNALKVVWAAPFVAHGEGRVEVWSRGLHHVVEVSLDRLAGRPVIVHRAEEDGFVKNGTFVQVNWPGSASSLLHPSDSTFYNPTPPPTVGELVENYAAFNPHSVFVLGGTTYEATATDWRKWLPGDPTSPHWYTKETLRDLIAAYVTAERGDGRARRTVREFVSEFRGLSSTGKQKQVVADLSGVYLCDLVRDGDIDMALVERLLADMQAVSRPPKPALLGVVGEEHIKSWMVRYAGIAEESVRYHKALGEDGGLPYVVEVAFGVRKGDEFESSRHIITGLNWSPTLGIPVPMLQTVLGQMRVDPHDPVTVVVHLARPRFEFVDRGKTKLQL